VGSELGYITTNNTETTSTQTVNYLDTGVKLIVRPYVGDDGFIRLEIHPEDSSGSLDANGIPSKTTTEVTSNIMVKDGHTIVIGGLFRDASTVSRSQVPLLGDLPIIGMLFRSKTDQTSREEITVLLTPHIIHDDNAYSDASKDELAQAEKLRVGVRKDMMPFGRERLAECEYEQAVAEMKKPNPDRHTVLWHLNAATDLNPTFSEAINLKESITGQVVTDSDNSTIRSFVRRQIMEEEANPTTEPAVPWEVPITSDDDSVVPPTRNVQLMPEASAKPTTRPAAPVASKSPAKPSAVTALPTGDAAPTPSGK
jgi:type IV pilus assembly protein PilQ